MKGYPLVDIINARVDLDQFDPADWQYDPILDVILVRPASRIDVFLALCINTAWSREKYYN